MISNFVNADEFNAVVQGLQADILKVAHSFELLSGQLSAVIKIATKQKIEADGTKFMLNATIEIQRQQTEFITELCSRLKELESGGDDGEDWKVLDN